MPVRNESVILELTLMDDVKVHYNSDKPSQLEAYGYTQGTNIKDCLKGIFFFFLHKWRGFRPEFFGNTTIEAFIRRSPTPQNIDPKSLCPLG